MNALSHSHELFNDSGCLSQDALEHYLQQKLTDDERKLVDDHLVSCPLCSDAIDGLSEKSVSYSPGIASHSRHINMRLRSRFNYDPSRRQSSRKGPALRTLLIPAAASIIIMLGIIGYFHYFFPETQELAIAENKIPPVQAEERTIVMENEDVPNTSQTDHPAVGGVMDKSSEDDEVVDKVSIGAGSAVSEIQLTEVQIVDKDVPEEEIILAEVNEDITLAKADVLDESQEVYANEEMVMAEEMEAPSVTAKSRAMHEQKKSNQEMVFAIVEKMPEFPGGMDSLQHFLQQNLIYPENIEHKTDTTVIVQFIINKRGKIKDIVIVRSAGQPFDDEAIRVIKLMPDWASGMQEGKPVSVKYKLPIGFKSE